MRSTKKIPTPPLYELEGFHEILRNLLLRVPPEHVLAAYTPEQLGP